MLLDMTGKAHLTAGSYFFRVIIEDTTKLIQLIKL